MRTLAAQVVKPVTLGPPPMALHHTRKTNWSFINQHKMGSRDFDSIDGTEDFKSVVSIDIEDEASLLLGAAAGEWRYYRGNKVTDENRGGGKPKAARKMVRINDKPEVINVSKKRKKRVIAIRHDGDLRPLKSILKVQNPKG